MMAEAHPHELPELGDDTPPRGWTITQWLRATWLEANRAATIAQSAANAATACNQALVLLRRDMVEAFRQQGVRMRDVARRAADSQVDAAEAKRKADEVESTAIRNFVEDAKPFGRWRRDLVVTVLTVLATITAAALCQYCGIHPIG